MTWQKFYYFWLYYQFFVYIAEKLDGVVFQIVIFVIVLFSQIAGVEFEHNMMKRK